MKNYERIEEWLFYLFIVFKIAIPLMVSLISLIVGDKVLFIILISGKIGTIFLIAWILALLFKNKNKRI